MDKYVVFKEWLKVFDSSDWITLLAAVIAFTAAIITGRSSRKSSKLSDGIAEKLGHLAANSQDKQRVVEIIASQRVIWINNVRQHFVDYNSNMQKLHFTINSISPENVKESKFVSIDLAGETLKTIYNIELFLNSEEMYSEQVILMMKDIRQRTLQDSLSIQEFENQISILVSNQNVILKAEWKRVKEETLVGDFLPEERVLEIFEEVGEDKNKEIHLILVENYKIKKSTP